MNEIYIISSNSGFELVEITNSIQIFRKSGKEKNMGLFSVINDG
jgi:hypothetical protein